MTLKQVIRVLLIDDDEDDFILTRDLLLEAHADHFELEWESNYAKAQEAILKQTHDVYLIDYRLGGKNGITLIKESIQKGCKSPLILLTGQGDLQIDYLAMEEGAADYLVKGNINSLTLARTIRYALSYSKHLQEINRQERKYRVLFEKSLDAIFLIDRKQLFMEVNPALIQLFGYQKEEIHLLSLKSLFALETEFNRFYKKLQSADHVRDFEALLKKSTGEFMECRLSCNALTDEKDSLFGYQGIIRDITQLKKAERELLLAEKLSTTGKLARTIAHEIRNPLTNLNLALEQLKDELVQNQHYHEEQEIYVDIMQRNALRIDQLISELLNSSKPKALNLQPSSLTQLMAEVLLLASDRVQLKGIQVIKHLDEHIPALRLDPEKIKIALLNVIINAIEVMQPDQGLLQIRLYKKEEFVCIEIQDNGTGIPEEEIPRIFEPFFTGKKEGIGLGLTSTKNIIDSHKGKIEVKSQLGKGATFIIYLNSNLT